MKGGWQSNYLISEKGIEEKKRSKEENYRKIEKRESKSKEKKRRLIEDQKRLE